MYGDVHHITSAVGYFHHLLLTIAFLNMDQPFKPAYTMVHVDDIVAYLKLTQFFKCQ